MTHFTGRMGLLLTWIIFFGVVPSARLAEVPSPDIAAIYPGKWLHVPEVTEDEFSAETPGQSWDFSRDGDFGALSAIKPEAGDARVGGGTLTFTTAAPRTRLAWGNHDGTTPEEKRFNFWKSAVVELRVRQSQAGASTWQAFYVFDNLRETPPIVNYDNYNAPLDHQTLTNNEWTTLRWHSSGARSANPRQGIVLQVDCDPGNRIEIDSLRLIRYRHQGFFRKTFEIPDADAVWRVVLNVGRGAAAIFVNGHKLTHVPALNMFIYELTAVDIAPYLRPGRNVIGIHGKRIEQDKGANYDPFVYCQGSVVLRSGAVISLDTDESWKASSAEEAGWSAPEFDDGAWRAPKTRGIAGSSLTTLRLPVYSGRLLLENPEGRELVFTDTAPVVLNARLPLGCAALKGTIEWVLHEVSDTEGRTHKLASGTQQVFRETDDSIVYALDLGQRPRGVYAVSLALTSAGAPPETRFQEPLMVVGRVPQHEVAGNTYTDGMKLELESRINFTDPDDPHPWVESAVQEQGLKPALEIKQPRIVNIGPLLYRETGANRGDMFSYRFRFQRPDSFYLMELDYPDDAPRGIAVSIQAPFNTQSGARSSPGVETGIRFPVSGRMQTLRWIHFGFPHEMTVNIVNEKEGARAAAGELRVHRIEGNLPALKVEPGERRLGVMVERGGIFGANFADWYFPNLPARISRRQSPHQWLLGDIKQMFLASERYIQYLRFTGQNYHMLANFQYSENNTPYRPRPPLRTARVHDDIRSVFMPIAAANNIRVRSSVSIRTIDALENAIELPTEQEIARGVDTLYFIDRFGRPSKGDLPLNWLVPAVRQAVFDAMLIPTARDFAAYENWDGLNFMIYPGGFLPAFPVARGAGPRDLTFGYGDVTIAQFERDTGIRVPAAPDDPQRFDKRYTFLTAPDMAEKWIAWRNRAVRDFLAEARDLTRRYRADADVSVLHYVDIAHLRDWLASGLDFPAWLSAAGIQPVVDDDELFFGRFIHASMRYHQMKSDRGWAAGWNYNRAPDAVAAYARDNKRITFLLHHFDEFIHYAPGCYREGYNSLGPDTWPWKTGFAQYYTQPAGDYARAAFIDALLDGDPDTIVFGWLDCLMLVGHEQALREFARVYTALPKTKFHPVLETDGGANLIIRGAQVGDDGWIYVANPGFWNVAGHIVMEAPAPDRPPVLRDLASGAPVELVRTDKGFQLPILLPPYGLCAYRASGHAIRCLSFEAKPGPEAEKHMRGIIAESLGMVRNARVGALVAPDTLAERTAELQRASEALDAGRAAAAWRMLTDWRLWDFCRADLPQIMAGEIRTWRVIGPFPNAKSAGRAPFDSAGEVERDTLSTAANFDKSYTGVDAFDNPVPVSWRTAVTERRDRYPNFLNFDRNVAAAQWRLGYAFVKVLCPTERSAILSVGSDDGIRVWLNRAPVHDHYVGRAPAPDQDRAAVRLKAGWNDIFVKLENQIGSWGFFIDFLDEDGKPMSDLTWSAADIGMGDGYSYRMKGLNLESLELGGRTILRQDPSASYLLCHDLKGERKQINFARIEDVKIRNDSGAQIYAWRGHPPGFDDVEYLQEWRFGAREIELTIQWHTRAAAAKQAGGYTPFLRFALTSKGRPLALESLRALDAKGAPRDVALPQSPGDRQVTVAMDGMQTTLLADGTRIKPAGAECRLAGGGILRFGAARGPTSSPVNSRCCLHVTPAADGGHELELDYRVDYDDAGSIAADAGEKIVITFSLTDG